MTMKTIKVAEATERQLDWLVAKCEGAHPQISYPDKRLFGAIGDTFDYSTDWAQGGPIIEREGLLIRPQPGYGWDSWKPAADEPCYSIGPTPLIAAMRCYVAGRLGDTAEVPEELE